MRSKIVRASLLGAVSLVAFTSEAHAGCVYNLAGTILTCDNTTTANTTTPTNAPNDRENFVDPTGGPVSVVINSGTVINGFGLAITQGPLPPPIPLAAVSPVTVTNNGIILVNGGNTPTAGGSAALNITTDDASIIYNGTGAVSNNGTGNGVGIAVNGAGSVTYDNRGAVTVAAGDGIVILGGAGDVTATTGQVTANAAGATGIFASVDGAASNVAVTAAGGVSATGAGGQGIIVRQVNNAGTGNASATVNSGIAIAANAVGVRVVNEGVGNATIVNNGSVTTVAGVAGDVDAQGGGNVSVSGSGTFNGGTGVGLTASAVIGGTVIINQSGAISGGQGIVSSTESGSQNISVGNVTGTANAAIDARSIDGAITILATGNLSGGNFGIFTQSDAQKSITIAAGHSVTTTGGADIAIGFNGDGDNRITNNGTIGQAGKIAVQTTGTGATGITNSSTGIINGSLQLGDGSDGIGNFGTFNFDGLSDFGGGADVFTNQASGTVNFGNATGIAGLETFNNAGRVNVPVIITLFGTTFNNLAGGQLVATGGNSRIGGALLLNNAGRIVLNDNTANDILTFDGNYVGLTGGSLSIDVTRDLTAADRLVVLGSVSGTTLVNVNLLPGSGMINTAGALIVDAGTSTANAFVLAPITAATGLVDYAIEQRGADYFLTATVNSNIGEVAALGFVGPEMWHQSFDVIRETALVRQRDDKAFGLWGQAYVSSDHHGDRTVHSNVFGSDIVYNGHLDNHRRGAQLGYDKRFGGVVVGITGGYERNRANVGSGSRTRLKGYNYGAYATFGEAEGFHGAVTVKRDNYHVRFVNEVRDFTVRPEGHSTGVDGEFGIRGGNTVHYDLSTGLSYVRSRLDGFSIDATEIELGGRNSLRGRLTGRASVPSLLGAYVEGSFIHQLHGEGVIDVINGDEVDSIHQQKRGPWGRIETGLAGNGALAPTIAVFANIGSVRGIGARAGFRF